MKRIFLAFLVIMGAGGSLFAQKILNEPNAQKRVVSGFHGIEVATGINLILTEGASEEVAVSAATTEFRDNIITRVDNGILKIYFKYELKHDYLKDNKELKAFVSYKSLDYLESSTGAKATIEGILKSVSFKMKANTGGEIVGDVKIDNLDVDQNTGSEITLSGVAGNMNVEGGEGSMFRGDELETTNCSAKMNTGAGLYITVQKELSVRANTGGYIKYKGDAVIRQSKTHTGGSVSRI